MTASYTFGTVTVSQGSTMVTGDGTGWLTANVAPGFFGLDSTSSIPLPVAEVVSDTELRLVTPWRGIGASGASYWLSYDTRDGQQTVNNAQRLAEYIARLDSRSLSAISALSPTDQTLILFTGSSTATLIPIGQVGGLFDVQVADLAARAAYDGRPTGFRVLVSDTGGGVAALYTKVSDASANWSDPAYVTGPKGDTGAAGPFTTIQAGNTTTLPAGSQATAALRTVSPGVVALDIGIPRGVDGTGTGDVVGPSSSVNSRMVEFSGTTGKLIKDGGVVVSPYIKTLLDDVNADAARATIQAVGLTGNEDINGLKKLINGVVQIGSDSGVSTRLRYDGSISSDQGSSYSTLWSSALASFSGSFASGRIRFPNGWIMNFGQSSGDTTTVFAQAFSDFVFAHGASFTEAPSNSDSLSIHASQVSSTSITWRPRYVNNGGAVGPAGQTYKWWAWGR